MPEETLPMELTPLDIRQRLDAGERLFLIDVRQPEEHQICHIQGSELIPVNNVPAALGDLEGKSDEGALIVFCHHGMRSLNVVNWLRGQGITRSASMSGGIDRWSIEIDPSLPRY